MRAVAYVFFFFLKRSEVAVNVLVVEQKNDKNTLLMLRHVA